MQEVPVPPFFRILFYTVLGLALIALGWEVAARLMENPVRLPAMLVVVNKATTLAQSADELLNDGKNPENVTTYGMGYTRSATAHCDRSTRRT